MSSAIQTLQEKINEIMDEIRNVPSSVSEIDSLTKKLEEHIQARDLIKYSYLNKLK